MTSLAASFFRETPFSSYAPSTTDQRGKSSCSEMQSTAHVSNDSELFNPMFYSMDNYCIIDDEFSGSDDELSDDDIIQCRPKPPTRDGVATAFNYDLDLFSPPQSGFTTCYLSTEPLDGDQLFRVSPLPSPYSTLSPTWEPRTPPKCRSWTSPSEHSRMLTSIKESDEETERRLSSSEGSTMVRRIALTSLKERDCNQTTTADQIKGFAPTQPLHIRRASQANNQRPATRDGFNLHTQIDASKTTPEPRRNNKIDPAAPPALDGYINTFKINRPAFAASRYRSLTF